MPTALTSPKRAVQFTVGIPTVQAQMSTDDLVHMAESVSLVNSPKIE